MCGFFGFESVCGVVLGVVVGVVFSFWVFLWFLCIVFLLLSVGLCVKVLRWFGE